jgi:hypothetical protein
MTKKPAHEPFRKAFMEKKRTAVRVLWSQWNCKENKTSIQILKLSKMLLLNPILLLQNSVHGNVLTHYCIEKLGGIENTRVWLEKHVEFDPNGTFWFE